MTPPIFSKSKNKTEDILLDLKHQIDLNLRTYESKLQQVQTSFETLRDQITELAELIKILNRLVRHEH